MPEESDRRKHPRVTLDQRMEFVIGQMKRGGTLTDLSAGGLGMDSPESRLTPGSKTRVSFAMENKQIEADARVVHTGPGARVGLEFVELAPHERLSVVELMRYLEQKKSPPTSKP